MQEEQNKAAVRRALEEGWGKGNVGVLDEMFGPNFVNHTPSPGQGPGLQGAKQFISTFRAAFPDLEATIEDQIAQGDKVVTRWRSSGTQTGKLLGTAPTNKRMTLKGITINRVVGGKIVEEWTYADQLGMMQQLGMAPLPSGGGS